MCIQSSMHLRHRQISEGGGVMNAAAITLKAMQDTPAEEFGNIARMQYGTSKTAKKKKNYVISQIGRHLR